MKTLPSLKMADDGLFSAPLSAKRWDGLTLDLLILPLNEVTRFNTLNIGVGVRLIAIVKSA